MVEKYNHPVKTARDGDYWRLLKPGEYSVTVHAMGYAPVRKRVVVPEGGAAATYNFVLQPSDDTHIDYSSNLSSEVKTSKKKPVPVSLIIGLTVICAISLALAVALGVMVVKRYRHKTENVESGYVAVQSQSD